MSERIDQLNSLLAPLLADIGLELWGIEFAPSHTRAVLRVYIDVADRHVGIEDCERASREISALLDVEDPIQGQYVLEVSSPGFERPLFGPAHYARYVGERVKLQLSLPMSGRRRFFGPLLSVDGERSLTLEQDGMPVEIPFGMIQSGKLNPDFEQWRQVQIVDEGDDPHASPSPAGGERRPRRDRH